MSGRGGLIVLRLAFVISAVVVSLLGLHGCADLFGAGGAPSLRVSIAGGEGTELSGVSVLRVEIDHSTGQQVDPQEVLASSGERVKVEFKDLDEGEATVEVRLLDDDYTLLYWGEKAVRLKKGEQARAAVTVASPLEVSPATLSFGDVTVGMTVERSVVIKNVGPDQLSGLVRETCADYSLVSGGGSFNLSRGEGRSVRVGFSPASEGAMGCTIDLGAGIDGVSCSGIGSLQPGNTPPAAEITAPSDGDSFEEGTSIQFTGSATDPEDGDLTGDALVWTSSLDGEIGTGESFARSDLSVGQHTITLTATDSGDLTDTDEVTIPVRSDDPPPPGSFVRVPSGSFIMGDGVAYCGIDERQVTLRRDFWIGQYEVTNQEYLELVQWAYDNGYVTATSSSVLDDLDGSTKELVDLEDLDCEIGFSGGVFSLRDAGHGINGDHPLKEVTWYGAVAYCDWLSLSEGLSRAYDHSTWVCGGGDPYSAEGYRLPTDAEWEYAAQWNDERIYPWGDESPTCSLANYKPSGRNCVGWTSPVGGYPAGAQSNHSDPIYDLAGNVWEWANDWYQCDLGTSPETDPPGPNTGSTRVIRGGSWSHDASLLRASYRNYYAPYYSHYNLGFRLARSG